MRDDGGGGHSSRSVPVPHTLLVPAPRRRWLLKSFGGTDLVWESRVWQQHLPAHDTGTDSAGARVTNCVPPPTQEDEVVVGCAPSQNKCRRPTQCRTRNSQLEESFTKQVSAVGLSPGVVPLQCQAEKVGRHLQPRSGPCLGPLHRHTQTLCQQQHHHHNNDSTHHPALRQDTGRFSVWLLIQ